jgi:hypothetical protein
MVFDATFNNISLYRGSQFYWLKETGVPKENRRSAIGHWQIYHIMLYRVHLGMDGVRTHNVSDDR